MLIDLKLLIVDGGVKEITNMNIQNLNEKNQKVLVFTAKEIEKLELGREDDFKDEVFSV